LTRARVGPSTLRGSLAAPPSKSYTHRALVVGYLAGRTYRVENPLESGDTLATARGLESLGASIRRTGRVWTVRTGAGRVPGRAAPIECGESGTTLRFLLPLAARGFRRVRFVGSRRLGERPLRPLLRVLEGAGTTVVSAGPGRTIAEVTGPLNPVRAQLDVSESSQFLSALLFALPTLSGPSTLRLRSAPVSRPYVEATLRVLLASHIAVDWQGRTIRIPAPQAYAGSRLQVPGDASSAAYLWAAGAVSAGAVEVRGVDRSWPQADLLILDIVRSMGATVRGRRSSVKVSGPLTSPIRVDLDEAPDLLPLVSVLAACVPRSSRIEGARHAAGKESDRRAESARLARALGATVALDARRLEIRGTSHPRPIRYSGPADHRVVMSAAVGALAATSESVVDHADAVAKSYPEFWTAVRRLGGSVTVR
jgi:3-phosphoshikimate 1-carboxyvinyltransferase